jgi:hypothetical protein
MLVYYNIKTLQGIFRTFVRHKTQKTTSSGAKEIKVYLHDLTKEIINQCGNKNMGADDYVTVSCAVLRYKHQDSSTEIKINKIQERFGKNRL